MHLCHTCTILYTLIIMGKNSRKINKEHAMCILDRIAKGITQEKTKIIA